MQKNHLPITPFREEILKTINENPVTLIVAETGSGKTTGVPQMLLDETEHTVVVTQPRRISARSVSAFVAQERAIEFGTEVAFRTAVDRNDTIDTRCLFCTDGLQLVLELTNARNTTNKGIVLIIDEVHEWNLNIETLIAWCRKTMDSAQFKLVIMSATLDSKELSAHFQSAPVITIPGKVFPVHGSPLYSKGIRQVSQKLIIEEIKGAVAKDGNILVFLPGKPEILAMQELLKEEKLDAMIIPLHGDLLSSEQDQVFYSYKKPKIILSTNIAQTSITIPDITHVIDSGLEKRIELVNGVETLCLGIISKSDVIQRAGRAGRTAEGRYVLCNNTPYDDFPEYGIPEINRKRLDQMVLRLLAAGLDATELPFFHQPNLQVLKDAKKTLFAIGAIDVQGKITDMGRKINRFPTSVTVAKMIIEATERKCLSPMLTIAAILETNYGSIKKNFKRSDPIFFSSWKVLLAGKKYTSDLFAELDLYAQAKLIGYNDLEKKGISQKGYGKAVEIRGQLKEVAHLLGYNNLKEYNQNAGDQVSLAKCILAGMIDHLYSIKNRVCTSNGEYRQISRDSVLNDRALPEWIVGTPKNITVTNKFGTQTTLLLVSHCTAINFEWVKEIAPHLITETFSKPRWEMTNAGMVSDKVISVNGKEVSLVKVHPKWSEYLLEEFMNCLESQFLLGYQWFILFRERQIHKKGVGKNKGKDGELLFKKRLRVFMKTHQILSLKELTEKMEKDNHFETTFKNMAQS